MTARWLLDHLERRARAERYFDDSNSGALERLEERLRVVCVFDMQHRDQMRLRGEQDRHMHPVFHDIRWHQSLPPDRVSLPGSAHTDSQSRWQATK